MLRFVVQDDQSTVEFSPRRVLLAGYTGRNEEAVQHHIEELRKQGIPAPESTPAFYPVLPNLLQQPGTLTTLDEETSGEAECVFLFTEDGVLVTLGSDHTDRKLEQTSVVHSKQLCPKPVAPQAWRLDDGLQGRWDRLELRSWVFVAGERIAYQEGTLDALMTPQRLFEVTEPRVDGGLDSLALYGGTLPTIGGELILGQGFEAELRDPEANRSLTLKYSIEPLAWFRPAGAI